jgi:hypothetical protein
MVAGQVHELGQEYEDSLKENETSNAKFSFLFDSVRMCFNH